MKLAETTTSHGDKVEAHRCEHCGEVHIAERGPFGILIIPCPHMPKNKIQVGETLWDWRK